MNAPDATVRYRRFSSYLKERFGCRVRRICVNAGFSCPNLDGTLSSDGCIYCNNRAFSAVASCSDPLPDQIRRGIEADRSRRGAGRYLVYLQPYTNTYGPVDRLKAACEAAARFPEVVGLIVGTRPDCLDDEKLDLLASFLPRFEVWVELGLQSASERTLRLINRNHTFADFARATAAARARNLKVCVHIILGLPGEREQEMLGTAEAISRLNLDGVKIHPLYVARDTVLAQWHRDGRYRAMEREFYVQVVCAFLEHLPPDTVIHRLTADCPPALLVAPAWIHEKTALLSAIDECFARRGTRQGSAFGRS